MNFIVIIVILILRGNSLIADQTDSKRLKSLFKTVEELKIKVSTLEVHNKALDNRNNDLEQEMKSIKTENIELKKDLKLIKTDTTIDEPVIFSALVESEDIVMGPITFEKVIKNVGNGFDVNSGIFTAVSEGTYIFSFSSQTATEHNVYVNVLVNSVVEFRIQTYEADILGISYWTNLSYTWMRSLKIGDKISLEVGEGALHNEAQFYRTTWNGILLINV